MGGLFLNNMDLSSNNEIILKHIVPFVARVNDEKSALNIRHDRNNPPKKSKYKFKYKQGEIVRISITMSKGEIMSHKGKGKNPDNRVAKPFYTPIADAMLPDMADEICQNTGEMICYNLSKL